MLAVTANCNCRNNDNNNTGVASKTTNGARIVSVGKLIFICWQLLSNKESIDRYKRDCKLSYLVAC